MVISTTVINLLLERERRAVRQEALEEEDFAAKVIKSTHDGILAYNRDLKYTVWNPAMERLTGMPAAEVIGKSPFEVFPFLREEGRERLFTETLAGHSPAAEHSFRNLVTGEQVDALSQHTPLIDELGQIVGGLGVVREITEERRIRAELEELRARVAELESTRREGKQESPSGDDAGS